MFLQFVTFDEIFVLINIKITVFFILNRNKAIKKKNKEDVKKWIPVYGRDFITTDLKILSENKCW